MKKAEELTQRIIDEITNARTTISHLYDKWDAGELAGKDEIEYYGAKKILFEYAWRYGRTGCTRKEETKLMKKMNSAWKMYLRLKEEQ